MSQIEGTKVISFVVTGPNADEASATKVLLHLILEPGESEAGESAVRQGYVHAQILRRS